MPTVREFREGTYQMLWDCPQCGRKKNLGVDHRHCPGCGAAQDANARYFPADHEEVPTKFNGRTPDLECEYCGSPTSSAHNNCVNCGGPLDKASSVHVRPSIPDGMGETGADAKRDHEARKAAERARQRAAHARYHTKQGHTQRKQDWQTAEQDAKRAARARRPQGSSRSSWEYSPPSRSLGLDWHRLGAIGGVALLTLLLLISMLWTKDVRVEVQSQTWERKQSVERLQSENGSDWCDSKPYDAYNVSSERKGRRYKKVRDGKTCTDIPPKCTTKCRKVDNGDGSFSRDCKETCTQARRECKPKYREEPVYDDYCRWTVDRWSHTRWVTESGTGQREPRWPRPRYKNCTGSLGCERLGSRQSTYSVGFVAPEENYESLTCEFSQSAWKRYTPGTSWKAKIRVVWGNLQCSSLQEEN